MVAVEIFADFFVLGLNMIEVFLSGVEVMFVLATVESSVAEQRR